MAETVYQVVGLQRDVGVLWVLVTGLTTKGVILGWVVSWAVPVLMHETMERKETKPNTLIGVHMHSSCQPAAQVSPGPFRAHQKCTTTLDVWSVSLFTYAG